MNPFVNLLAVNADRLRRRNADANLVSFDPQGRDFDVIADSY